MARRCERCGADNHMAKGRCNACYQWWLKFGTERPFARIFKKPLAELGVRRCRRCQRLRHFSDFDKVSRSGSALQTDCRACHREREREQTRLNPARPIQKICEQCGSEYMASVNTPNTARFCSKACGSRHWVENNRERRRAHKTRRYAVERGARRSTNLDREAIFNRDGWICQLCRKKVNPALRFPHPMSPSLDHVIPLSQGGTHEPHNVQLAHFSCNCRKKDRSAGEQLLLVG